MKEQDVYKYREDDLPVGVEDGGGNSQPSGWTRRSWFLRAVATGELSIRESTPVADPGANPESPPSS